MTTTAPVPAPAAPQLGLRERISQDVTWILGLRWALVVAATVIAFWNTLGAVVTEMGSQTIITYLPAVMVLVLIAATGVSWRRGEERPIHDRQTDVIAGVVLLFIAMTVKFLNLRYTDAYLVSHVDLLALWVFALGSCALVFGLRPVARYRWVWFLLLMIFPVPYRMEVLVMRGGPVAAGVVMVAFAAAATWVASARTWRRGLVGASIAAVAGTMALFVVRMVFPDVRLWVYQTVPAVAAALAACAVLYVDRRRVSHVAWSPLGREKYRPAVKKVGRPGMLLAAVAIAMAFIPIPTFGDIPNPRIDGLDTRPPMLVPSGWVAGQVRQYEWVSRMYGRSAVMTGQDLYQSKGSLEFDKFARPRKVVVNTIESSRPITFEVYPIFFVYDLVGDRFSEAQEVPLPHGVVGHLQTVVDDTSYLTFNRMTWEWNNGTTTQRVTIVSVDNHEPDAQFPSPQPTVVRNLNTFITVLFRGNSVVTDLEPQFKDRDLLIDCATDLINAQVDAIGTTT
ncbi:hypothetical protein [Gordonia tangerina]|uniref:Uncharacterized protein n=1 Tax=Gordonia tangerina TaxID=2911060 RepID=A0ABS9DLG6_9ACTN|nr:hypothetical protein [Gordonia tangerina]MCF3939414.1 hypothetical protein [Gordonia tangerina]